ncbi:MAG: alpha/beta fold hydrolase [Chloroflexi bacterium]|nr:alpha/beta fold hydrolase [Chloroflexota bacterium]MCI0575375.1 alpha/beta fold hydrolase [Chloroflexota bacterium]MCI0646377.1 alpha/beta fold hydrolase [Chloroflexota bacterium]MCI0728365.1 alpha/beta fold hydrolase [Chloroflexota bacterium]
MHELWIDTPHGRIYGQAAGDAADPLVLGIHGWSQRNGWHTWEPLLEPLGAAGFYAASVDMPGWGQSRPANGGQVTGERAVQVVLAILDSLGKESAALMGKSWGGGVALAVALEHPRRVSRLILTAPAFNDLDRLRTLPQPVLLAWAEDDPVIPYRYAAEFVRAIPNARLETYPTGGHSAAPKNAADFTPKAIAFLRSK